MQIPWSTRRVIPILKSLRAARTRRGVSRGHIWPLVVVLTLISPPRSLAATPEFSLPSGIYTNATITFTLTASAGTIRYTVDGSVPTESSPPYTAPLTVGTNVVIKARTFEAGLPPGLVVSRVYQFLEASAQEFSSNLPLLILTTSGGSIPDNVPPGQPRAPGALTVIDTHHGRSALNQSPQFCGLAEFEIFGQTAVGFPKLPYTIEIQDEYRKDRNVPLLGLPAEADWKLRGLYNDKTFMNEVLAFELFEKMGHYTPRQRYVEVFVSRLGRIAYPRDYVGLRVLLEKIEAGPQRVPLHRLTPEDSAEPDISGGYIWKKEKDSIGDLNFATPGGNGFGPQLFKIHEPKPREITTNQVNWLRNHLAQFERSLYAPNWLTATGTNHYSHYIDLDSFVDQHWIVEFTRNIDGYRLGNFMRKDRGGKIKMDLLWDWELSFGNADYLHGGKTNGWYWNLGLEGITDREHVWLRRLLYGTPVISGASPTIGTGDPDFIQAVVDRWGTLRTNILSSTRLLARVDQIAAELAEAVGRDVAKYPRLGMYVWPNPSGPPNWDVDYVRPTNHVALVQQMKKWIQGRYLWIDNQMVRAPVLSHAGGPIAPGLSLTLAAREGTILYTLDGTDPRLPGGAISPRAVVAAGPIIVEQNVRVFARARTGDGVYDWSPPTAATFVIAPSPLRVTEIMYHAAAFDPAAADLLDYIELRNVGSAPLNVAGHRLSGTLQFTFPSWVLSPGARVLVVRTRAAFEARYGGDLPVVGEYAGLLPDGGGAIRLEAPFQEPVLDFRYEDDWFPATDGSGFSLVFRDDTLPTHSWGQPGRWRPSASVWGSPGLPDPDPSTVPQVIINEVLASIEPPDSWAVELKNPGLEPVSLGGWFFTDDLAQPRKLPLPANTVLAPGEHRAFTKNDFGPEHLGTLILSAKGGQVHLLSGDLAGNLTGYAHTFTYAAQETGTSVGRHITSQNAEHFVAQENPSLGLANTGPKVGPVLITDILYRPAPDFAHGMPRENPDDQFIELANAGVEPALLFDPLQPQHRWKLQGTVEYVFPPGTSISPGGFLLVTRFDPAAQPDRLAEFRARHQIPGSVPVLGPFTGSLNDPAGATLALLKPLPLAGGSGGDVSHVLVEQVRCSTQAPWPEAADGTGFSLARTAGLPYADDPAHWAATLPTPGTTNLFGVPPTILHQPQAQSVATFESVTFAVEAVAAATGSLRYQWRRNGAPLPWATNSVHQIDSVQLSDAGEYDVVILGDRAATVSLPAKLNVLFKVAILEHPLPQTVPAGSNVTFTVSVESVYPVRYQWRHDGTNLPWATNQALFLQAVSDRDEGNYTVVCTDSAGTVTSQPAELTVLMPGAVRFPSPPVHLTATAGDVVTLGVELQGTLPIYCRWRFFGSNGIGRILTNQLLSQRVSFITLPVAADSAGAYTVILSNSVAAAMGKAITNATLTLAQDGDHDLLPDDYETLHGLNPANPADGAAQADADGDGLSNRQEYLAGTDPQDGSSYLKVNAVNESGFLQLRFGALSNRTYTVQHSDSLAPGIWRKLGDILARHTNRVETMTDRAPDPEFRFYRVVTPLQP